MGLPELSFAFSTAAQTVSARSKQGIVAMILHDAGVSSGVYTVAHEADIPSALGADNKAAVKRTMIGSISKPSKIYLAVIGADAAPVDGLDLLTALDYDYIVGPHDMTGEEAASLAAKVKELRAGNYIGKAVLPNQAADYEGVINFTGSEIVVDGTTYTTAEYCGRIAGILAGTPVEGSATGAALPEVTSVKKMTETALDTAIKAGQLVLYHDGRKVRLGRAVNSKTTLAVGADGATESKILKKIKAIEAIDLIHYYAVSTADDEYRGQCPNTYDNKMVLVAALRQFLKDLEAENILDSGTSGAELDLEATRAWLKEEDVDVSGLTDAEILQHNTEDYVFITMYGHILDAMEDFRIGFVILNR